MKFFSKMYFVSYNSKMQLQTCCRLYKSQDHSACNQGEINAVQGHLPSLVTYEIELQRNDNRLSSLFFNRAFEVKFMSDYNRYENYSLAFSVTVSLFFPVIFLLFAITGRRNLTFCPSFRLTKSGKFGKSARGRIPNPQCVRSAKSHGLGTAKVKLN